MIDPFGSRSLFDFNFIEAPEYPRYELPKEVIPGVPWPKGFREDFMRWSKEFLGTKCIIPRGTAYILQGHTAVLHPKDAVKLINCAT